jgi:hypothetical protein
MNTDPIINNKIFFASIGLTEEFVNNILMVGSFHSMFEHMLSSHIARLCNTCTTARNIVQNDGRMVLLHPLSEL